MLTNGNVGKEEQPKQLELELVVLHYHVPGVSSNVTDAAAASSSACKYRHRALTKSYSQLGHVLVQQGHEGDPQGALWHQFYLLCELHQQVLFLSSVVRYGVNLNKNTRTQQMFHVLIIIMIINWIHRALFKSPKPFYKLNLAVK